MAAVAASGGQVRIHGLREVNRAFARIDKNLVTESKGELAKAAAPVAADAQARISKYAGAITGTIKPIATQRSVFVRQTQRDRSGKRGDFGALQMQHLIGAMYDEEAAIVEALEDWIDWLGRKEGF